MPLTPCLNLAVAKSPTSVQAVPFHDSVIADTPGPGLPATTIAAVVVPTPSHACLAVFISGSSDQLDPLYSSTLSILGSPPAIHNAAV